MIRIENAFLTEGTSVYDFFQKPGVGLYIPLYQRQYSWDEDNIEQLLDDISRGIESLSESDDELRFLGTIITVVERNPNNIQPLDRRGLPTTIWLVIDGQQRLSTLALFATQLHMVLKSTLAKFRSKDEDLKNEIVEITVPWLEKLVDLFSFDLKSGKPARKPKIIRGSEDKWVKDGAIDENYRTDIANYIAQYIASLEHDATPPTQPSRGSNVGKNLNQIKKWLNNTVSKAHLKNTDDFPSAKSIIGYLSQSSIWRYDRPNLIELVKDADISDPKDAGSQIASLIQMLSVCHYLLERCCFTSIQPINDKWAFDMFQSLNATGTPLTAIETFKPFVVNITRQKEGSFKESKSQEFFAKVEGLFKGIKSASRKNKLTNDFLSSFSITVDGKAVSSHFSQQRKWLDGSYSYFNSRQDSYERQCEFVENLGYYAQFYKDVWLGYSGDNNSVVKEILTSEEGNLVSVLLLYLKDCNHKMSITILANFYRKILKGEENSISEFVNVVKLIASFYTIWRSAQSNSGLDNVYRQYFKGIEEAEGKFQLPSHRWKSPHQVVFSSEELKEYFVHILEREGLWERESWLAKASRNLNYRNVSKICRFALFVAFHDAIPDEGDPGLIKAGMKGIKKYLTLELWNSNELKTVEHVAPQTRSDGWDARLYTEEEQYHKIGNLTLLPSSINKSAGNRNWDEKLLYYKHLSEKDPSRQKELANKAEKAGIILNPETIKMLQQASYNYHIQPIVQLGECGGEWDSVFVKKRTNRILELMWEKLTKMMISS